MGGETMFMQAVMKVILWDILPIVVCMIIGYMIDEGLK